MGFLNSIFGGGDVSAPTIEKLPLDQFGTGIEGLIRGQANTARQRQRQVNGLTTDVLGSVSTLDSFPTLGEGELANLRYQEDIFNRGLASVQASNINNATQSLQGLSSSLGLGGIPLNGAGAISLAGSIASRNQAAANTAATTLADNLQKSRNELLNFAYTRQLNKFNAQAGLQGAFTGQQASAFANVFNANTAERAYKTDINETNAQMQFAADTFNSQAESSMFKTVLGAGVSLGTSFLGGK